MKNLFLLLLGLCLATGLFAQNDRLLATYRYNGGTSDSFHYYYNGRNQLDSAVEFGRQGQHGTMTLSRQINIYNADGTLKSNTSIQWSNLKKGLVNYSRAVYSHSGDTNFWSTELWDTATNTWLITGKYCGITKSSKAGILYQNFWWDSTAKKYLFAGSNSYDSVTQTLVSVQIYYDYNMVRGRKDSTGGSFDSTGYSFQFSWQWDNSKKAFVPDQRYEEWWHHKLLDSLFDGQYSGSKMDVYTKTNNTYRHDSLIDELDFIGKDNMFNSLKVDMYDHYITAYDTGGYSIIRKQYEYDYLGHNWFYKGHSNSKIKNGHLVYWSDSEWNGATWFQVDYIKEYSYDSLGRITSYTVDGHSRQIYLYDDKHSGRSAMIYQEWDISKKNYVFIEEDSVYSFSNPTYDTTIGVIWDTAHKTYTLRPLGMQQYDKYNRLIHRVIYGYDKSTHKPIIIYEYHDWYEPVVYYSAIAVSPQAYSHAVLYPNPCNDKLTLELHSPVDGAVRFDLLSIEGKKMFTLANLPLTAGDNLLAIALPEIPAGMYIYSISGNGINYSGKIIKK